MIKNEKTADIIKPFGEYKTPGPNKNVITILKETLEQAEKGEIVSIAMAFINSRGWVRVQFETGSRGMCEIIGSVAMLQNDLITEWNLRTDDSV